MEISLPEFLQAVTDSKTYTPHPYHNKRVLAVMPHGFIHFGLLHDNNGRLMLTEASNLRYWSKRDGGLPEFAKSGPKSDDHIDEIGEVSLEAPLFFYPLGDWS